MGKNSVLFGGIYFCRYEKILRLTPYPLEIFKRKEDRKVFLGNSENKEREELIFVNITKKSKFCERKFIFI